MSLHGHTRQVKSFVLRQGKITTGQLSAINALMPIFGIEYQDEVINLNDTFGRNNLKVIEIGFGMGDASWQIAKNSPEVDYLGIEVHSPGVGSLLMHIRDNNITNMKIIRHDAIEVLNNMIADNSISGFHIYFPDPWPKKRHHKRRIIQNDFLTLLCKKLMIDGYIHLATDWQEYSIWMLDTLRQIPQLTNIDPNNEFIERPDFRPMTKFEQRGLKLGHRVWDLIFKKTI